MIKDLMDLKMRMSVVFFVVLLTVALLQTHCGGAAEAKKILSASKQQEEDMELEKQFKLLNKPPFKTFHTRNGDIIDCIDIYRQPAFNNPLLKNHKIQMNPSFVREHAVVNSEAMTFKSLKLGHESEECPQGTVPIPRTRKQDLINKSHSKVQPNDVIPFFPPVIPLVRRYEVLETNDGDVHYGVKALIKATNPLVGPDQLSSAQIWVQSGPPEDLNLIEAGWIVYPSFHEDTQTRLYTSWSGIGEDKGCINYFCAGFVQVDQKLAPGINFDHLSVSGGDIYALNIEIALDQQSGNWWLTYTENNTAVRIGYWPKELFNSLAKNATKAGFGAVTGAPANRPFPQMGDGNFPSTELSKCGFIAKMQTIGIDGKENDIDPEKVTMAGEKPPCYDLSFRGYVDDFYGFTVALGGPGGSCG